MNNFNYELSDTEIIESISTAVDIAEQLFGPISAANLKDTTTRMSTAGFYASLSRLAIAPAGQIEGIVVDGTVFTPQGESELYEDEENGTQRIFTGSFLDFNIDSASQTFTAGHALGTLTVDAFGDIELVRQELTDPVESDPGAIGPAPSFDDQLALAEIRTAFLR